MQNEKKKREYIDLIIHGVASDWVKSCLKDKEGKLYNPGRILILSIISLLTIPECLQVEGPPLVTNSAPDGNYIPLVKVDDRIELRAYNPH